MNKITWIVFGCLLLASGTARSFDCSKAKSRTEVMICDNAELRELDNKLDKNYRLALKKSIDKQQLVQGQRQWVNEIRSACQDVICLNFAYQDRISDLIEYGGLSTENDIVKMDCDPDHHYFNLKYDESSDQGSLPPTSFQECQIGNSVYKVLAFRESSNGYGQCMADPPIIIWVYRNTQPLVVGTIFGSNCFGGDSLDSYEVHQTKEEIDSVKFCEATQGGARCKTIPEANIVVPIDQNRLGEYRLREYH